MSLSNVIKTKDALGATLLVTGCCIGAGMIGFPVMSALAGFIPSSIAMVLCYLFTTATGLLLLEATLWFEHKVNLPSIVAATLGNAGKSLAMLLFLFLFYCLFVAYLDGGGLLFADILSSLSHHPVSREIGILTCVSFVGATAYAGTKLVAGLNRVLLVGLVISYLILVAIGVPKVNQANLTFMNWTAGVATIPILLICFGFQNIVPSLTYYLNKNVNVIRFAIIVGNLIPFCIYFLWNFVIIGMLSDIGSPSIKHADMVTDLLVKGTSQTISVMFFIKSFSLFAILTPFILNAVSFADFLKDGLKKSFPHEEKHAIVIYGLIFIPPLICTLVYPHLFLQALSFAGGFIDVLLFGVLPAAVILVGRNVKNMVGPYQVAGGNFTPVFILILSLFVLIYKIM